MGSEMYRLCQTQAFPIRVIGMVLIGLTRQIQPDVKKGQFILLFTACTGRN